MFLSASQLYMNHLKLQRYLAKCPAAKVCATLGSSDQPCVKLEFFFRFTWVEPAELHLTESQAALVFLIAFGGRLRRLSASQGDASTISSSAVNFRVDLIRSLRIRTGLFLILLLSPRRVK